MILAGGRGTRFKEYTEKIPKPMIEALGKPLLIHIIEIYKKFNVTNIIILGGYKNEIIVDYFARNYETLNQDTKKYIYDENITVTVLDTGLDTMTGGRIKKGMEHIDEDSFYVTYGDGIADVDISKLTKFHIKNRATATLTAVRPPARFGSLDLEGEKVIKFGEKENTNEGWINGGYFVLNKEIGKIIDGNNSIFEKEPLEEVANKGGLYAYKHNSFWQCCDTIRELEILESAMLDKKITI
mgnify:FL=1